MFILKYENYVKKIICIPSIIIVLVITETIIYYFNNKTKNQNIENENSKALIKTINDSKVCFSNLRWVECGIKKTNGPVGFYYKKIWIPPFNQYTIYSSKRICQREITINRCSTLEEISCQND